MRLSLAVSTLALASAAAAWNTYVVPHTDGADDSPALLAALATGNYSTNATILFQKGKHYNIWTPIKFPVFTNVEIAVEGNLSYPLTIKETQDQVGLSVSDSDLQGAGDSCMDTLYRAFPAAGTFPTSCRGCCTPASAPAYRPGRSS